MMLASLIQSQSPLPHAATLTHALDIRSSTVTFYSYEARPPPSARRPLSPWSAAYFRIAGLRSSDLSLLLDLEDTVCIHYNLNHSHHQNIRPNIDLEGILCRNRQTYSIRILQLHSCTLCNRVYPWFGRGTSIQVL